MFFSFHTNQVFAGFAKLFGYRGLNPSRLVSSDVYFGEKVFIINGIDDLDFADQPKLELVRMSQPISASFCKY